MGITFISTNELTSVAGMWYIHGIENTFFKYCLDGVYSTAGNVLNFWAAVLGTESFSVQNIKTTWKCKYVTAQHHWLMILNQSDICV
jgi:hypothetical protein